ncbi:MAG: carbohydrate porin [Synechococcus sp.]
MIPKAKPASFVLIFLSSCFGFGFFDSSSVALAQETAIDETSEVQAGSQSNSRGFGGPSSVGEELNEDARIRRSLGGDEGVLAPWNQFKNDLERDIGLQFGVDYNVLYQTVTDSLTDEVEAGGGIFRFFGNWTVLGRDTSYPGSIVFKVENRHPLFSSSVLPQNLGFEAGYNGLTGTQFSDIGWGVTNLYWRQDVLDGRIALVLGKVDPTDYVDVYGLSNPLTQFQNLSFLTDPTIAAPNQGLGAAIGAMVSDNIYVVTGFSDANGDATEAGFDTFFNDAEYFKHFELGWTTSPDRIYFDNIHLTAWHTDAREEIGSPDGWGLAFSGSWFLDDKWMPFLRAGYSEGDAALMEHNISLGFGRFFPSNSHLVGTGLSWGKPAPDGLDDQFTAEVFYRIQVTPNLAITPSVQLLQNPALNPDRDTIGLLGLRARVNF